MCSIDNLSIRFVPSRHQMLLIDKYFIEIFSTATLLSSQVNKFIADVKWSRE